MRYFSMFSGIGGFEYGIEQIVQRQEKKNTRTEPNMPDVDSGNERGWGDKQSSLCIGYSEIDKYASAIYRYHYPEHIAYGDATTINVSDLPDFDLLVGGFPCQSFSIAGKRKGFDESRGTLFFEIARILKHKRPRYFVLENVKGLLSHDDGKTFTTILGVLSDIGYEYQWQVLNSKDFGVPQNRERVFIVGHLRGERRPEVFPVGESNGIHGEKSKSTNRQVIGRTNFSGEQLQTRKKHSNNQTLIHNVYGGFGESKPREFHDISPTIRTPKGGGHLPMVKHTVTGGLQDHAVTMIDKSTALTEAMGQGGGHTPIVDSIRKLTPTECERLQAFPDGWTEKGVWLKDKEYDWVVRKISDTQRYRCLGNAVTTSVITAIIERLL